MTHEFEPRESSMAGAERLYLVDEVPSEYQRLEQRGVHAAGGFAVGELGGGGSVEPWKATYGERMRSSRPLVKAFPPRWASN